MSSIYDQLDSGNSENKIVTTNDTDGTGRKKVLGKGLSALISDLYGKPKSDQGIESHTTMIDAMVNRSQVVVTENSGIQELDINQIQPNKDQPRTQFAEEKIQELADSIKEQGVIQPVIVKKAATGYELICGERRFRAAKQCGLEKIPAIVKEVAEDKLLEWALIENIQRQDLNALEEANAYLRLAEERHLSHDEIGKKVGKNRTTVVNSIRLLRLPKEVLSELMDGKIQAGHARALLSLPTAELQVSFCDRIIKEKLSVREAEEAVLFTNNKKRRAKKSRSLTPEIKDLETKLQERFGTQVRLYSRKNNQGRLEFKYFSLDDLDRLLGLFGINRS